MLLSSDTHYLARRALAGEWSAAMVDLEAPDELMAELENLPDSRYFSRCVRYIAETAPVRITPGELIVGSATLKAATYHILPLTRDGEALCGSTSHVTFGFDRVLELGYNGLRRQIEGRLDRGDLDEPGVALLHAMLECIDAANVWHGRYIELLEELAAQDPGQWNPVLQSARNVPNNPPNNFREAVQSLWFLFCFQRLCGNWSGLGRIDEMLGRYLAADIETGQMDIDLARELIAHFWIKGAEWAGAGWVFGGSGDAQYYQNVILAGVDADGNEVCNPVTYMVLDVIGELMISDYPVAVRLNKNSPPELLDKIARVQRQGGGIVSIYNEDTVISALQRIGIPESEARRYVNDGCWEPQIPGETCFSYNALDILQALQDILGVNADTPPADFESFEELYAAYSAKLEEMLKNFHNYADNYPLSSAPKGGSVLASLMTSSCIERGRGYYERGANYNIISAHAGGIPDAANSLLVIEELVYNRKELTLPELVQILRGNWEGHEELRQRILREFSFYGNDSTASDRMARRILDDFVRYVEAVGYRNGVYRTPGVSTFGREIGWREMRGATAAGFRKGEILACNFSPTPGTEKAGPTAALSSYCAMGLDRLTGGAAMELKFHPSAIEGEAGIEALVGIMRAFMEMGGFYLQVDAVSKDTLLEAQRKPEQYTGLAVRVSGWSARFVTLSNEWQDMIINRTEH